MVDLDVHVFCVNEVTNYIKARLANDENLQNIWIEGELSNFVSHSSGHLYFTLKDERSQLPCAMFRWACEHIKFEIKNGMKVLVMGNVDVYTPQGRYNFIVHKIHLKGTGELYLKYIQLKEKLEKEGLFEVKYKKPIPKFPKRIGVVTSSTGAALRDIITVTGRRFPLAEIIVVPTLVQGEGASSDIVRAIKLLNRFQAVDVAIVGRGGGSLEDLWPFNDENVARVIFESQIPIVSAVGHETDFFISDFVSDLRAPTPSAAAELVVPDMNDIRKGILRKMDAMAMNMHGAIKINEKQLSGLIATLKPTLLLNRLVQNQQQADELFQRMLMHIKLLLEISHGKFNTLKEMLDTVSPLSTLKRGYSITLKLPEKKVLVSSEQTKVDDDVLVVLHDGELKCQVKELKKGSSS